MYDAGMKRLYVLLGLAAVPACGAEDGEPIGGDVTITVGDEVIEPTVGAALPDDQDPTKALIVVGTRDISCATTITTPLKRGTYLMFSIDPAVGMQTVFTSVIRVESSGSHLNGSSGEVTIDSVEDRVTGSVTFDTTDDEVGPITAAGTFDVLRCF